MKWKTYNNAKTTSPSTFLVLPLVEVVNKQQQQQTMPKNPGLRLFTKTYSSKSKEIYDQNSRPLTATLDKPQVLDIRFITKIDMSLVRKEFLTIANLCRAPITVQKVRRKPPVLNQKRNANKLAKSANKMKSSRNDENQNSVTQTTTVTKTKPDRQLTPSMTPSTMRKPAKNMKNDGNNNCATYRVTRKKINKTTTKLPQPCNTCGRPDVPERFHSHPEKAPLKETKQKSVATVVKSVVQKPVPINYKPKLTKANKATPVLKMQSTPITRKELPNTRVLSAKGPRTLCCYVCGREFGTMSLPLHEPKCLEKWDRENASLPAPLRRKRPVKPDHTLTKEEYNNFAWESSQANLVPCKNCGRTFYPDRLSVHQKSCKPSQLYTMIQISTATTMEKAKSIEAEIHRLSTFGLPTPEDENPPDKTPKSLWTKIKLIFTNLTVEPILMCYTLPSVMASLAVQNLNLEKACRVNLEMNETICEALAARNSTGYGVQDEIVVQKLVSSMNAWKNVIQSLVPAMLLMFLGSWSDRHSRRKPCIILPIFGELLSVIGFLICTYYFYELPMEFAAISESVPPSITGGWFCMFMGVFSYISSVSTLETRTLRIGAVSMFSNGSFTIGTALSGILYKEIGFYGVFGLALVIYVVGIAYATIWVKEPVRLDVGAEIETKEVDDGVKKKKKNFFQDFFDLEHISETFRVAFKNGKRNRKKRICIIMVLVMVIIGPMHGEYNVNYLYVRHRFGWNEIDYSIYSTFNIVVHMCGTLFSLMFFSKYLKLDDSVMGMISSLSKIASSVVYAFAKTPFVFYLGAVVEMFNGTSFIAMRSITSKLVPPDELGKINSLFGVSEALIPLIYGPMYSMLYNHTIKVFPGSYWILGGVLTIPAVVIFGWLYKEHKMDAIEDEQNKLEQDKLLQQNKQTINEEDQPTESKTPGRNNGQVQDPATQAIAPQSHVAQPKGVHCSVCGRMFGTKSIKFHEPQCLKKWHMLNDNLPKSEREPLYSELEQAAVVNKPEEPVKSPERESSTKRPPMFPCYLCGRLFSVKSIYIHEPQCLKKWHAENEKLPPSKRKAEPLKPDVKFTRDGKADYRAMAEANWQCHLQQLVPCKNCGRTFTPDRVCVHEKTCRAPNRKFNQDIKVEIF